MAVLNFIGNQAALDKLTDPKTLSSLTEDAKYKLRIDAIGNTVKPPKRGRSRESMSGIANIMGRAIRDEALSTPYSILESYRFAVTLFDGKCYICNKLAYQLDGTPVGAIEADHIIPPNRGGSGSAGNMAPAHKACNDAKGDSDVFEYLSEQPETLAKIRILQQVYGYSPATDEVLEGLTEKIRENFQTFTEPLINEYRKRAGNQVSYVLPPSLRSDEYKLWRVSEWDGTELVAYNDYLGLDLVLSESVRPVVPSCLYMLLEASDTLNSRFYLGYTSRKFSERLVELRGGKKGLKWVKRWGVITPRENWDLSGIKPKIMGDFLANHFSDTLGSLNRRTVDVQAENTSLFQPLIEDLLRVSYGQDPMSLDSFVEEG